MFAIKSLYTMMDIFPTLVNAMCHAGLPKAMVACMENSMGLMDIIEACIKAFERMSNENPPAVLRSGAIACMLQQMDFLGKGI